MNHGAGRAHEQFKFKPGWPSRRPVPSLFVISDFAVFASAMPFAPEIVAACLPKWLYNTFRILMGSARRQVCGGIQ